MSLPPERISIKRRRQEEPVDTLILEQGSAPDKKRRFTDFFFQRLRNDNVLVTGPGAAQQAGATNPGVRKVTNSQDIGIPNVKSSIPGDEIKDFVKYKAAQEQIQEPKAVLVTKRNNDNSINNDVSLMHNSAALAILLQRADQARRFHLTRDVSSALKPNPAGGIRRRKLNLRPPVATFVERRPTPRSHEADSGHITTPVDSIVHLKKDMNVDDAETKLTPASVERRVTIESFSKAKSAPVRMGQSIRDDPATWDHESDQLAEELSKLALELDPDAAEAVPEPKLLTKPVKPQASRSATDAMLIDNDDDYVFETYVRVRHTESEEISPAKIGTDFGILIIDEEDEDLWERYIHSDDEDDWDEEDNDSNAEDNPRNDYPDDEVSTDDESGAGAYKYRRYDSDREEYDDDW